MLFVATIAKYVDLYFSYETSVRYKFFFAYIFSPYDMNIVGIFFFNDYIINDNKRKIGTSAA